MLKPEEIIQITKQDYQTVPLREKLGISDGFVSHPILLGARIGGASYLQGKETSRYGNMLDGIYWDTSFEAKEGYLISGTVSAGQYGLTIQTGSAAFDRAYAMKNVSAVGRATPTWNRDREIEFAFKPYSATKQTISIISGPASNVDGPTTARHIGIIIMPYDGDSIIYATVADGTTRKTSSLITFSAEQIIQVKIKLKAEKWARIDVKSPTASSYHKFVENIPTGTTDADVLIRADVWTGEAVSKKIDILSYKFQQAPDY